MTAAQSERLHHAGPWAEGMMTTPLNSHHDLVCVLSHSVVSDSL